MLDKAGVTTVDALLITHTHHDHCGAYQQLAEDGRVGSVLVCHPQSVDPTALQFYWFVKEEGQEVTQLESGAVLQIGSATAELWVLGNKRSDLNERSGVVRLSFGGFTALFMADTREYAHSQLLKEKGPEWLACDLFRYPHHGADALSEDFRAVLQPELIVLTTTPDNPKKGKVCAAEMAYTVYTCYNILRLTTDGDSMKLEAITEYAD